MILLADIDNTLYDWPSFFAPSFRAMIHALAREMKVSEDQLYDEAKSVFAERGSLEYAYWIQELESAKGLETEKLRRIVEAGRGAFKSVQSRRLVAYPGVVKTLEWLSEQDVMIVGITNSSVYRAQHRLYDLKIDCFLDGLVAWEGFEPSVNDPANLGFTRSGRTRRRSRIEVERVLALTEQSCKPNEEHYLRALRLFDCSADQAWAIGDSKAKDLEPAARLGIKTIWARYGSSFNPSDRDMATLLRITPWSSSKIQSTYNKKDFEADFTIDAFEQLKSIIPQKYPTLF
ncbi:MAG: HAD family hydrolase [Terracidiphilus sp.]